MALREASVISHALLYPTRNPKILSWLAQELKKQIPHFDPYGQDIDLLVFAYQDLETCLGVRWKVTNPHELHMRVAKAAENSEELKAFLKVWIGQWLGKWRQRVRLLQKNPRVTKRCLKCVKRARRLYRKTEHRKELTRMVFRKLINQGEICMIQSIAENLIIKEIAKRLQSKGSEGRGELNPVDIFNSLSSKIEGLKEEKGPLIYLKIRV